MAKNKRGHWIKKESGWRGTCPICHRTRVKVLWDKQVDGAPAKVCKRCSKSK